MRMSRVRMRISRVPPLNSTGRIQPSMICLVRLRPDFLNPFRNAVCALLEKENKSTYLQSITVTGSPSCSLHAKLLSQISVISQRKWLKFGLQAHFLQIIGHTKFQLSISCTFIVMKHLVKITKYTTKTFNTLKVQDIES